MSLFYNTIITSNIHEYRLKNSGYEIQTSLSGAYPRTARFALLLWNQLI